MQQQVAALQEQSELMVQKQVQEQIQRQELFEKKVKEEREAERQVAIAAQKAFEDRLKAQQEQLRQEFVLRINAQHQQITQLEASTGMYRFVSGLLGFVLFGVIAFKSGLFNPFQLQAG